MFEKILEIRGISRHEIINYLIQLNSKKINDYEMDGIQWQCHISDQTSFRMFQSDIPQVTVTFSANSKEMLDEVIANFRKKTFRAGG